jgi:hypothetical protein
MMPCHLAVIAHHPIFVAVAVLSLSLAFVLALPPSCDIMKRLGCKSKTSKEAGTHSHGANHSLCSLSCLLQPGTYLLQVPPHHS